MTASQLCVLLVLPAMLPCAIAQAPHLPPEIQQVRAESLADLKLGKRHAILVGVDGYEHMPRLAYATKDMRDLGTALGDCGFEVTLLADETAPQSISVTTVTAAVTKVASAASAEDTLLVVLSAHGHDDATGKPFAYLRGTDPQRLAATGLDLTALVQQLQQSAAGHKLLMLDLCRYAAGTALPDYRLDVTRLPTVGIQLLASAGPDSLAWEPQAGEADANGKKLENGVFTHFVRQALAGAADQNSDRWITFRELAAHVENEVRRQTRLAQRPRSVTEGPASFDVPLRRIPTAETVVGSAEAARRDALARWAEVVRAEPDPVVVPEQELQRRIADAAWPWCVRDRSTGIEFVLIPAGSFVMGSPDHEPGRDKDEVAHTRVIAEPFYMSQWEVTVGQYERRKDPIAKDGLLAKESVSWDDAQRFLKAVGNRFRLPSEAEWEYACRAGSSSTYAFGEVLQPEYANFDDGREERRTNKKWVQKASEQARNGFGLFGVHGNVWEWVQDAYGPYRPELGQAAAEPLKGQAVLRVMRGGGYASIAQKCRAAERGRMKPGERFPGVGFRIVRSLP
jgi:formylglycine-generating enzyme